MKNKESIADNLAYISLQEEGFEPDQAAIEQEYANGQRNESSLAIKILSVLGGILATFMFLSFLLISGLYNSKAGLVIFGILFIGTSIWLNIIHKKLIIDTLSISAYGVGLFLIGFGLERLNWDADSLCFVYILISVLTIVVTRKYILSFVSILTINGSLIFLLFSNELQNSIHLYTATLLLLLTFLFLNEAKLLASNYFPSKLYGPFRIGLLFALISSLSLVGQKNIFDFGITYLWISSFITIPLNVYAISVITKTVGIKKPEILFLIYFLSALFLIPTAMSPAISGALLIILLSFLTNYKTGFAIGVVSFIYFISQYYYDLNFTLLTKSIILFASGVVFLLFYVFAYKIIGQDEKL